ncbi:MAG: putative toxin-antitoxin system toxin component, PIN family [Bacteroidia bacterium]|nr:putative toxin-antitoxin system toxin component, PIN family [Bacteroidia bacterium]
MRVVLDTNVLLVSISDRSPYHWVFLGLLQGEYELCVTTDILFEYAEIIERHMGVEASESLQGTLDNLSNVLLTTSYFRFDLITKDRDDNKFVDCAVAANAHFIVSEDRDFRVLETIPFPKIEVLSLKEFKMKLVQQGI